MTKYPKAWKPGCIKPIDEPFFKPDGDGGTAIIQPIGTAPLKSKETLI
jgi:hypothetical protein